MRQAQRTRALELLARSLPASTATKALAGIRLRSEIIRSGQWALRSPWKNQGEPLSARTSAVALHRCHDDAGAATEAGGR